MTESFQWSEKDSKVVNIKKKMLQWAVTHKVETNGKKIGSLSKEIGDIMKNQIEILGQMNAITELKNSVDGLTSRVEEGREITQSE